VRRKDCHGFGVSVQAFKESLTAALAGEKESFFDAAILIFSPFAGLRPSRSGEALTLNFPKPGNDTSPSLAAPLTMLFRTLSRIAWACVFVISCVSARRVPGKSGKGGYIAQLSLRVMRARSGPRDPSRCRLADVMIFAAARAARSETARSASVDNRKSVMNIRPWSRKLPSEALQPGARPALSHTAQWTPVGRSSSRSERLCAHGPFCFLETQPRAGQGPHQFRQVGLECHIFP
jgi:hypothetical protein